ncbi:MAG: YicC family protein [Tannerella sp.]|nr:YicC family protein [Tannerella sp.]
MIQSMTGFGKAVAELPDKKVTVEIKSLNSKQLDLNVRVSPVYREKEMQIRNEVMQRLERGKIDITVNVENIGRDTSTQINLPVLEGYVEQIREASIRLHIAEPADWFSLLLRMPDAVKNDATLPDDAEWDAVHGAFIEAVRLLTDFRMQEGAMLQKIFEEKIAGITLLLEQIDVYEEERIGIIKIRIAESLNKFADTDYDRNRFEQEMIYYMEKLDVNEEKKRLDNHLKYFVDTLHTGRGQGKKLGFIAQEIGREINTLGSKSNHAGMQKIVVQMKDELEQIREQVLNVL